MRHEMLDALGNPTILFFPIVDRCLALNHPQPSSTNLASVYPATQLLPCPYWRGVEHRGATELYLVISLLVIVVPLANLQLPTPVPQLISPIKIGLEVLQILPILHLLIQPPILISPCHSYLITYLVFLNRKQNPLTFSCCFGIPNNLDSNIHHPYHIYVTT